MQLTQDQINRIVNKQNGIFGHQYFIKEYEFMQLENVGDIVTYELDFIVIKKEYYQFARPQFGIITYKIKEVVKNKNYIDI